MRRSERGRVTKGALLLGLLVLLIALAAAWRAGLGAAKATYDGATFVRSAGTGGAFHYG